MFAREVAEEIYALCFRLSDGTIKQVGRLAGAPSDTYTELAEFNYTPSPLPTNIGVASEVPVPVVPTLMGPSYFEEAEFEWRVLDFSHLIDGSANYELHIYVEGVDISRDIIHAGDRSPFYVAIA